MSAVRKIGLFLAMIVLAALPLAAQSVEITQIDSSGLMAFQKTRVYARVLGADGDIIQTPDPSALQIWESGDGGDWRNVGKLRVVPAANKGAGISFLFLIDNSGSMYDALDGTPTQDAAATRAAASRAAAEDFLSSIPGSSRDSLGLAAFNTSYGILSAPARDRKVAGRALDKILRPRLERDETYTELYASLSLAAQDLGRLSGRKALVVLSDGENYPFHAKRGQPSPQFGTKDWQWQEAVEEAVRQGVTVFAINFDSAKQDPNLREIALQTGGFIRNAASASELAGIYAEIRERILTEILLEYTATMAGGDKRLVKLSYAGVEPDPAKAPRYYYAGTVFGRGGAFNPLLLLALPLGLILLFLLSLIRFEKPSLSANLSLLYAPGIGHGTRMFNVGDRTVIGSDKTADITITGSSRLEESPVTVVKDPATGLFTIAGDQAISINNREVKSKTLEPGDVINFNGTMVVFDDAEPKSLLTKAERAAKKKAPPKKK